jgi:alanine dehydrogenase
MEVPELKGLTLDPGLLTMEKRAEIGGSRRTLKIGVPREVSNEERRVSLAPGGVGILVANGHELFVEVNAGEQAHFSDSEYADAGAEIVQTSADVYSRCELIIKVGPPSVAELDLLQEKQILISALHLGETTPDFLKRLMALGITAIGFEFMRDSDGTMPIVRMMHEIMGSMAVQIAARYLESGEGGKGEMLGGISGVPPSTVVILGAGVVGEWAARGVQLAAALRRREYHPRARAGRFHRGGAARGRRGRRLCRRRATAGGHRPPASAMTP